MSLNKLRNKTILVTGGTGSFGYAFIKKIINSGCKIKVYSRDELKQFDMRAELNAKNIEFFVGDVRDESALEYVMKDVDYVFHAAALKQVPSCEFFPLEAVKTNIIGSDNVINCAIKNQVKHVVLLSTDNDVSGSSSEIVRTPVASLILALDGLTKVIITVSSTSSKLSEITETGINFDVSTGLNLRGVEDIAV